MESTQKTQIEGTSAAGDLQIEETSDAESTERTEWSNNSIFHAPAHIRSGKESNVKPKLVPIGPYYHGQRNLKRMEDLKLRCFTELRQKQVFGMPNHPRPSEAGIPHRRNQSIYNAPVEPSVNGIRGINDVPISNEFLNWGRKADTYYNKTVDELYSSGTCFIIRTIFSLSQQVHESMSFLAVHIRGVRSDLLLLENQIPLFLSRRCMNGFFPIEEEHSHSFEQERQCAEQEQPSWAEIHLSNNAPMEILMQPNFKRCQMPRLKIDMRQTTLLVNLIAFENCILPSMQIISCYMKLMDALINSEKDANLLQKCGVIYNTLSSHEMAAIFFNEIGNFCFINYSTNQFSGLYKDVQEYDSSWHRRWASLRQNYFSSPWAGISVVAAVTLLILSALQTFYSIYGYYKPKN
ncbi:UPF0481 protein At3g47200-like [Carex rostrata]